MPEDKNKLFDSLKKLTPPEFDEVVTRYGISRGYLSIKAPQVTQATELLQHAESNVRGLAKLAAAINTVKPPLATEGITNVPGSGAYRHCDRENQDNDFRALFSEYCQEAPGEPQFYLIHGDEGECHGSFVARLCDTHIKYYAERVFGRQRTDVFVLHPAWSHREAKIAERDLNFNLLKALADTSGERLETSHLTATLTELLSRHMGSVVILCYDLAAQNWHKHTPALLQGYCDACREASRQARKIHSQAAHCLVFVNLIYPGPEQLQRFSFWERITYSSKRIENQVQSWHQKLGNDYRCQVVEKLCPVTWDQARDCIEKLVLHEDERLNQLNAIFGKDKQARMVAVEKALRGLIQELQKNAL